MLFIIEVGSCQASQLGLRVGWIWIHLISSQKLPSAPADYIRMTECGLKCSLIVLCAPGGHFNLNIQ